MNEDNIKIKEAYPPNYKQIRDNFSAVKETPDVIFAYGDTIYNPHKIKLEDHVIVHEIVHLKQQDGDPDKWYARYFESKEFRLDQEVKAYGLQYAFICEKYRDKNIRYKFLFRLTSYLRDEIYGLDLNHMQLELKIKKEAKRHQKSS